jgi:prephenate dehydrogenase
MKRTMGIVGFGRFGRFAAFQLRGYFDLSVFDSGLGMEEAREMGFRTGSLEDVAKSSIVLLCVPISEIRSVLMELAPYLTNQSLVVDTCSVKEYPVFQMKTILPPHVEILGTHPLFGPDSAAKGIQGKKIVLCPVRIQDLSGVERFLNGLGLNVLVCSPEAHDRGMASTQAIVQYLGRAFLDMGLTRQDLATPGYDTLIGILEVVQHDARQLFCDLQTFNRFAKEMREKLVESLLKVNQNLE